MVENKLNFIDVFAVAISIIYSFINSFIHLLSIN